MEVEYYGANCFRISTKQSSIVIDDDLDQHGQKNITKDKDALLISNRSITATKAASSARLVLDSAGEFEVGDISVRGVQTRGHLDEEGNQTATVFQCTFGGASVTLLGHVHPDLSEEIQELAGGTDVLIVPVGGNGYTLDPTGATSAIKNIEPDVVIPSYYDDKSLKFEVPAAPLEDFIKISGLSPAEAEENFKVGKSLSESSQTQLVILTIKKA